MAEVVELVPKEAVGKVGETRKPKTGRFRLMAIAKAQREAAVEPPEHGPGEAPEGIPDTTETVGDVGNWATPWTSI